MKNVYEFYWDAGGYGSGVLLIAADTEEEAKEIARDESKHWKYDSLRNDIAYLKNESCVILLNYYQE